MYASRIGTKHKSRDALCRQLSETCTCQFMLYHPCTICILVYHPLLKRRKIFQCRHPILVILSISHSQRGYSGVVTHYSSDNSSCLDFGIIRLAKRGSVQQSRPNGGVWSACPLQRSHQAQQAILCEPSRLAIWDRVFLLWRELEDHVASGQFKNQPLWKKPKAFLPNGPCIFRNGSRKLDIPGLPAIV